MICLLTVVSASFMFSLSLDAAAPPAEEETIAGMVVKSGQGVIIEADDGDYLVKGPKTQEIAKMAGKLLEVTGIISESPKGDVIEVKSFEEIQE
ncbi:MAG: hypothetical protein MUF52_10540 [Syntrophobacteraceae bacterium]|nr:hypothetical protein [Syntrophobacteraceae bacterium]